MNWSGLSPFSIRQDRERRAGFGKPAEYLLTLPFLNGLNQIIDTVDVNGFVTIEIGRETRQTSTDVRTGHRGKPAELTKLALTDLKLFIVEGSVPITPKRR